MKWYWTRINWGWWKTKISEQSWKWLDFVESFIREIPIATSSRFCFQKWHGDLSSKEYRRTPNSTLCNTTWRMTLDHLSVDQVQVPTQIWMWNKLQIDWGDPLVPPSAFSAQMGHSMEHSQSIIRHPDFRDFFYWPFTSYICKALLY